MSQDLEVPKDFLRQLPDNLPVPIDDRLCSHLTGLAIPSIKLTSTSGSTINLGDLLGTLVIYCYPMTGKPNHNLPKGWIEIPGAAGCTPQSCSFRDHHQELKDLNVEVFGISTQTTADQIEAAQRLNLPFQLLSDRRFEFAQALNIPMFEVEGRRLLNRVTLIVKEGKIVKYFYPVFPPDQNIKQVLNWLSDNF
jgi:peroxiredoxin